MLVTVCLFECFPNGLELVRELFEPDDSFTDVFAKGLEERNALLTLLVHLIRCIRNVFGAVNGHSDGLVEYAKQVHKLVDDEEERAQDGFNDFEWGFGLGNLFSYGRDCAGNSSYTVTNNSKAPAELLSTENVVECRSDGLCNFANDFTYRFKEPPNVVDDSHHVQRSSLKRCQGFVLRKIVKRFFSFETGRYVLNECYSTVKYNVTNFTENVAYGLSCLAYTD